jgi:hypothetical protein
MPRDRALTSRTNIDSPNAIYNLSGPSTWRPKASYELEETGASFRGAGTPEGNVTAPVGSTYHRTDGGAGTSFYV